ncbi:MAG: phosphotransferase [Pseudomonadota bacterium]
MAGFFARLNARRVVRQGLGGAARGKGLRLHKCLKTTGGTVVYAGELDHKPVVIKRALGPSAADLAGAQARELAYQHPRMGDGPYRVPEPILSNPEVGLVVMGQAPGQRLDHALRDAPERRRELIAASARWLAHYIAPRREVDTFGGGYWIKRRLAAIEHMPASADRRRIETLIGIMRREKALISGRPITRARSHGDFCAINLMVDGDDIWGVDIQNSHWLAVAKDIARFLVYLEIALPAGHYNGPCGLSLADCHAFLGERDLISADEANRVLPYFVASEVAGRLISEQTHAYMMSAAQALADRLIEERG